MFNAIEIKNFQSHKHTRLELSPGVNVIIGPSDSGKTAIIRALRWVIWNRPSGDSIRSWWGGNTEVKIMLPSSIVSRIKGKENLYTLGSLEFKAVGKEVPEEVQKEINFGDINLQQQLDRPFLLADSAGEVAQHFNKMAQLDAIDRGMHNIKKWIHDTESEFKAKRGQLKDLLNELKTYDYLDRMEDNIETIESLEKKKRDLKQTASTARRLIIEYTETKKELKTHTKILDMEDEVGTLLTLQEQLKQLNNAYLKTKELVGNIKKKQILLDKENFLLKLEEPLDSILNLFQEKRYLQGRRGKLFNLLDDIKVLSNKEKKLEKEIIELEKQMPEICPFCGQKMPDCTGEA